jgi:hypothetical protein
MILGIPVSFLQANNLYDDVFRPIEESDETIQLIKDFESDEHENIESGSRGINVLNNAFGRILTYWKQVIGALAVMMIVIAGFRIATSSEEETINSQKQIILWCVIGLILTLSLDVAVKKVFYGTGEEGRYVFESEENIRTATTIGKQEIEGIVNWIMSIMGAVSVLMIFHSGVRLILALGSEDVINKEKYMFYWVGMGLVMITLSKILINTIYTPLESGDVRSGPIAPAIIEFVGLIKWGLVGLAVIAFASLVYGGFLILFNWGYEEGVNEAKKIIFGSIIGLVVIFTSYAIVATMLSQQSGYG